VARDCTVCAHPDPEAIDQALVGGVSLRDIARQRGVSKDAVNRHNKVHVSAAVVAIRAEQEREHGLHAARAGAWAPRRGAGHPRGVEGG